MAETHKKYCHKFYKLYRGEIKHGWLSESTEKRRSNRITYQNSVYALIKTKIVSQSYSNVTQSQELNLKCRVETLEDTSQQIQKGEIQKGT